jgi:hypothetical protein
MKNVFFELKSAKFQIMDANESTQMLEKKLTIGNIETLFAF